MYPAGVEVLGAIISSSRALGRMRTPSSSPPCIKARMNRSMSVPVAESLPAGAISVSKKKPVANNPLP
jgi:hypothetical protein